MNKKDKQTIESGTSNIKLVPIFLYTDTDKKLKLEFKIGNKQLYKILNLPEFFDRMLNEEEYKYNYNYIDIFSLKESYIKCIGSNINHMKDITFNLDNGLFSNKEEYEFKQIKDIPNYVISICTKKLTIN